MYFWSFRGKYVEGGGPPGEKINFFHVPIGLIYVQKKGGIDIITFEEKVFILGKITVVEGDLK